MSQRQPQQNTNAAFEAANHNFSKEGMAQRLPHAPQPKSDADDQDDERSTTGTAAFLVDDEATRKVVDRTAMGSTEGQDPLVGEPDPDTEQAKLEAAASAGLNDAGQPVDEQGQVQQQEPASTFSLDNGASAVDNGAPALDQNATAGPQATLSQGVATEQVLDTSTIVPNAGTQPLDVENAYPQGHAAFINGQRLSDNPYAEGVDGHEEWVRGWNDGQYQASNRTDGSDPTTL